MNKLGVHALVWVGGWTHGECERAIAQSAETGYDLNPLGSIGRGATFGSSHRTDEDEAVNKDQEVTA